MTWVTDGVSLAQQRELVRSVRQRDAAGIHSAMAAGVPAEKVLCENLPPLVWAASHGETEVVMQLVDCGADVNTCRYDGDTAVTLASAAGHEAIVSYLMSQGAEPDCQNKVIGYTPLMCAAEKGHLSIVQVLLENGASPVATDAFGKDAEGFATDSEIQRVLRCAKERLVANCRD